MKSFGIVANAKKDKDLAVTKKLIDFLITNNRRICLLKRVADVLCIENPLITVFEDEKTFFENCEIAITLGGDGTFLKTARKTFGTCLPIVGVNLGTLGFLAEIDSENLEESLTRIINKDFFIETRMVLQITVERKGKKIYSDSALNEAVITSKNRPNMLHINTYINDIFLEYIPGDGVIISTPTGSTAYSLSAGGPLVEPDTNMIIVTPMCPHTLFSRACITSAERTVSISIEESKKAEAILTVDGQNTFDIKPEDKIIVKKSEYTVNVIRLNPENFFEVLRAKIYNRGIKQKNRL